MPNTAANRDKMQSIETDIVIVGAGPAGLSAAIRLRQLAQQENRKLDVLVLEKGAEVGAHILSGAIFDPAPLDDLLPHWRNIDTPLKTRVNHEQFLYLGEAADLSIPSWIKPPLMNNRGHYIISLAALTRWLAEQAEALGVEIYPGQAATAPLYDENDRVTGVITGAKGVGRDGRRRRSFSPPLAVSARFTLIAEGARGTLANALISHFKLDAGRQPQKYALGLKELWELPADRHRPGLVQHMLGWPLDKATQGGGFVYHMADNLASVGFVVHLDYRNPYLSPYQEFQRFKTHPLLKESLERGRRIGYGARVLTVGGWQSVPQLAFPGGALLGCAAGLMNVPRLKGIHNAMRSGMLAAEAIHEALAENRTQQDPLPELDALEQRWRQGPIGRDLHPVRNVKPLWHRLGTLRGLLASGAEMWLNTLLPVLGHTLAHDEEDRLSLSPAAECTPPAYPAPDDQVSFDIPSSLQLANIRYNEDQPIHLKLFNAEVPIACNLPEFAEPARFYCPAGVYEIHEDEKGTPRFVINAQNCLHCKCCEIKDPWGNIAWTPPEGGDGPNYGAM